MPSQINIMIAVPAYGGSIKTPTARTLLDLQFYCFSNSISCWFDTVNIADVVLARNHLASRFLAKPEFTHLLMIDSDMAFKPPALAALLAADKPLIGAACPKREIDIGAVIKFAESKPPEQALALASIFNTELLRDTNGHRFLNVVDGIAKVSAIGMALCLIRREVLTSLRDTGKIGRTTAGLRKDTPDVFGFFNRMECSPPLMEDLAFCERWRTLCGGDVWAHVGLDIDHIGDFTYSARYLDRLKAGQP